MVHLNQLYYAYIFYLSCVCACEGGILITELIKNVFKRKRENKNNKKTEKQTQKNIFQLKGVHYKVRLRLLETTITHACCSTDILFGSIISEPSLKNEIPSQMGLQEAIS